MQDINLIKEDIERAIQEEMKKEIEKQKTELYASLKIWVIRNVERHNKPCQKSNLELKDNMMQYLKDEISSNKVELVAIKINLEKWQEAVQKCISTVKANVTKERQTWAKMAKEC